MNHEKSWICISIHSLIIVSCYLPIQVHKDNGENLERESKKKKKKKMDIRISYFSL